MAFPSKSDGLFVPESLIFRSDSNGEDLGGYAGAGLYDSITMDETVTRKVDYGSDRCEANLRSSTSLYTIDEKGDDASQPLCSPGHSCS